MSFHGELPYAERYGPWALVAGASDGVGAAYARAMAVRGINVLLIARRQAVLAQVAADIRNTTGVEARAVAIDLAAPGAFAAITEAAAGLEIGMLMYNAGSDPYYEPFLSYPVEPDLALIQRNCVVPTQLCHHFAQGMVARGKGGIVLVSSAGGLLGMGRMVAYGGTKAYNIVFAEALWTEVNPSGVDVLAPILGATDTPFLRRLLARRGMLADPEDQTTAVPGATSSALIADGVVANLTNGPTWYATEDVAARCEQLRGLPRNEAVRRAANQANPVMNTQHS